MDRNVAPPIPLPFPTHLTQEEGSRALGRDPMSRLLASLK